MSERSPPGRKSPAQAWPDRDGETLPVLGVSRIRSRIDHRSVEAHSVDVPMILSDRPDGRRDLARLPAHLPLGLTPVRVLIAIGIPALDPELIGPRPDGALLPLADHHRPPVPPGMRCTKLLLTTPMIPDGFRPGGQVQLVTTAPSIPVISFGSSSGGQRFQGSRPVR